MSAVLGAFVQYLITFILLVAAAAGGIFCGKKLRTKKNMESNTAGTGIHQVNNLYSDIFQGADGEPIVFWHHPFMSVYRQQYMRYYRRTEF